MYEFKSCYLLFGNNKIIVELIFSKHHSNYLGAYEADITIETDNNLHKYGIFVFL